MNQIAECDAKSLSKEFNRIKRATLQLANGLLANKTRRDQTFEAKSE